MDALAVFAAVVAALLTAALFAFVAFSAKYFVLRRRYAHIPSPKSEKFLLGHILAVRTSKNNGKYILDTFNDWYLECGPVYWFAFFTQFIVVAVDPESVKTLSTRSVSKPSSVQFPYVFGQRFIKRSVATVLHYDDWKDRRKTFDQAFTKNYLRGLVPVYNRVAKRDLIEPLRAKADGTTTVLLKPDFSRISLQVISEAAFGADFERDPVVKSIAGAGGLTTLLGTAFDGLQLLNGYPFVKYLPFVGRKCATAIRKIREIGRHCIELRMKALDNKEEPPFDIMSQILSIVHIEKNIDIEDLVDEFFLFYLADFHAFFPSQETTSTLLSFTTGLLIEHPDILQRVREEIDEVVGDKTSVEADDLDKLTYMNQVLEETLRLYPAGIVQKEVPPGGLSFMGYDIPAGTTTMTVAYCPQRNPENFDDPLKFDPNRFGPGQKRPSPYVYFPFGIGHRSCMGRVFAMMEAKVVLVHLLRTYNLSLPTNYCLKLDAETVMLQPAGGLPCTLTLRE